MVLVAVGEVDHIIDEVARLSSEMAVGETLGPITTAASEERIRGYIDDAEPRGAADPHRAPMRTNIVLGFENREDAMRYALVLKAQEVVAHSLIVGMKRTSTARLFRAS